MMLVPVTILLLSLASKTLVAGPTPDSLFDQYGTITWSDEMARLDNFGIQLQQWKDLTGYILVLDANGGCPGEAQARAIRAKRYVVEYRHIPRNRIVWRVEGYQTEIFTTLLLAPREMILPKPFKVTIPGKDGAMTKRCRIRLNRIMNRRR